ncbi:MAG: hypothetical protein JWO31_3688, partial [Phycisphaerales bacterium]|nr:hypothetical protein [Phycisphaerales bacterium]
MPNPAPSTIAATTRSPAAAQAARLARYGVG